MSAHGVSALALTAHGMSTNEMSTRVRHLSSSIILPVEVLVFCATAQMRFFVAHLEMVRNFHRIALIPWLPRTGGGARCNDERQSVIKIERDGKVGIDLKFGTITFKQEDTKSYAVALIDVLVGGSGEIGTRVQMEIKVAADPETESIVAVTETCRAHIVATLRAAADTFDATTARALLFHATGGLPAG